MLYTRKLAVTGPLAAVKSTVCRFFALKGAYCVSADRIVSQLLDICNPIILKRIDLLGQGVVNEAGELNKITIASLLFSDPKRNLLVESWTDPPHPLQEAQNRSGFISHPFLHLLFLTLL